MRGQKKTLTFVLPVVLALSAVLTAVPAYGDDTGWLSPISYQVGTTGNGPTNPEEALADDVAVGAENDDNCAWFKSENPGGGGGVPDSETYFGFGFDIPEGATITGIEVCVSGYRSGKQPNVGDLYFAVALSGDDGGSWTAPDTTGVLTKGSGDQLYFLGGDGNTWGVAWTREMFNDGHFRLDIAAAGAVFKGEIWKLDSIQVKVYYQMGVVEGTWETAFAYGGDDAICFLDIEEVANNRWGWTNGPLGEGSYIFELWAAAGQCDLSKGTLVGAVYVEYDDGTAVITYKMDAGFTLGNTHVYVGDDVLPTIQNGAHAGEYTVAPGQYPYSGGDSFEISGLSGDIYVIAHAEVFGAF